MSGGGDSGSDQLRRQEGRRQTTVDEGLKQLASIFEGGSYGTGAVGTYQKGGKYFTPGGIALSDLTPENDQTFKDWLTKGKYDVKIPGRSGIDDAFSWGIGAPNEGTPGLGTGIPGFEQIFGLGGSGRDAYSMDQIRAMYGKLLAKSGSLFTGAGKSEGFGEKFYNQRAKDFQDFALPQVAQQAKTTRDQLAYKLADQGILRSGAARQLSTGLNIETDKQKQGVADQGRSLANTLKQSVEGQRNALTAQLQASGSPSLAAAGALRTAATAQAPSTFAPLNNMFANWSNTFLANQVPRQPSNMGGFGFGNNGFGSLYYSPSLNGASSKITL